ncbi:hypothetical protein [Ferruginibacter sp.]
MRWLFKYNTNAEINFLLTFYLRQPTSRPVFACIKLLVTGCDDTALHEPNSALNTEPPTFVQLAPPSSERFTTFHAFEGLLGK